MSTTSIFGVIDKSAFSSDHACEVIARRLVRTFDAEGMRGFKQVLDLARGVSDQIIRSGKAKPPMLRSFVKKVMVHHAADETSIFNHYTHNESMGRLSETHFISTMNGDSKDGCLIDLSILDTIVSRKMFDVFMTDAGIRIAPHAVARFRRPCH